MSDLIGQLSSPDGTQITTESAASGAHRQHVDLFNFDDPRFENYRYVLTSPRSIEACQRLGVKPVSLLPKSFARFQDEMKNSGLDVRELYDRFLETEKKRLEMVELCRDERRKVVDEELSRQKQAVEGGGEDNMGSVARSVSMDGSKVGLSTQTSNAKLPLSTSNLTKRGLKTSLLPNKTRNPRSNVAGVKLAATFGLGVPANYEAEQKMLGNEADKARCLADARAEHSNRLAQLKQQLEDLELETRMLRLDSGKPKSAAGHSVLRKSVAKSGDNTIDETWLMSEMKKHVDFSGGEEQKPRPARAQSAGGSSMRNAMVSGVSLFPPKKAANPEDTPLRQMISSHVDEIQRQVENQRVLLEQTEMVDEWRYLLAERKKAEEAQARARRRRLVLEKKLKTQQERLERQLAQRGNLRRLEEEEQAYREMLRTSINTKDRRTEEMLRDKGEEIERSRTMSRMSERLREEMRRSVNADSFDKKAQRVVLENAVGRGPRTHLTNVSKLKLG